MKISVIIPTYKPQSYLWECLDSLVKQTFPKEDFEILLVLNGCCEPYKSEIERYISTKMQRMNVNFIHTEQGGVSNARNIALDNAKGEYVTFIDDDDFVSEIFLEGLYKNASYDTISLCYPYAFMDGDMSQISYPITDEYDKMVNKGKLYYPKTRKYFSGPWMKLIPRNYIQGKRFDIRFKNGEDSLFMFAISDKFKWVDFTSRKVIYYRRYRENSAVTTKRSINDVINNNIKMIKVYTKDYLSSPLNYNWGFYLTRMLGAIKGILNNF